MVVRSIVRTPTGSQSPVGARYWNVERITLDATVAARQTVALSHTPLSIEGVVLVPSGGPAQRPGIDFRLAARTLKWDHQNDGLYGVLADGDRLLVMYHSA